MESLIASYDTSSHALLESPTGTGKTLSLLAATLSWIKTNNDKGKEKKMKLFYASRTHAQISQLISELKSTPYLPSIAILASREHLCINKDVRELNKSAMITKCHQLIKGGECRYYSRLQSRKKTTTDYYANKVLDVEELFAEGARQEICPYYLSKLMVEDAHIIFLPYTFLTHEHFFHITEGWIKNAVLVFDEAHNAGDSAEEVI